MKNNNTTERENFIFLIVAIALFVAIADLPYGYYQLLRWFICGVGVYGAYINYQSKRMKWAWTLGVIALIFNPFSKFYFEKGTWKIIDLIAGLIFFIYFFKKKRNKSKLIKDE